MSMRRAMATYRAQARAETTKRLIAQLVNEGLVDTELSTWSLSAEKSHLRITNKGDAVRSIQVTVIDRFEHRSQWRPNDFEVPIVLKHCTIETEEDDPGSVWEFIQSWLDCDSATSKEIAGERNSAAMLVTKFFPSAEVVKSIPNCGLAQAAIRTITVPGFQLDIKFSLACLLTSAIRALPCWAAAVAPDVTDILKKVFPEDLWVFGEVAAVTGNQEKVAEARHLTCILRENLESRAEENNETLILASALMERPLGGHRTYAEILFDLETEEDKIKWVTSYIQPLLRLALDPLQRFGIGCEFHAQNTVARICHKTKAVKGFAVRDLAGIKIHKPTLERQGGFDLSNIGPLCSDDLHRVWDRVHHALIQNNIGYMLYALDLEKTDKVWAVVRSVLYDLLADGDHMAQDMYRYFVQDTMPFKCFLNMRMSVSFGGSIALREKNVPNVLSRRPRWLTQLSLAAAKGTANIMMPQDVNREIRAVDKEAITANLADCVRPYGTIPDTSRTLNPYPALLPQQFIRDLERFNEVLALAYNNIIPRWWKDAEAKFSSRMPLDPQAEALLRWVEKMTDEGTMRSFVGNQGNLRPDILIPICAAGNETLGFRVCEINARFPINFLHWVATAYEALVGCTRHIEYVKPASNHNRLLDSLLELFNPELPIHFVRDKAGMSQDGSLFGWLESQTGIRPRIVSPSDLRLVPDATTKTGFMLCCVWGADTVVRNAVERGKPAPKLIQVNGELVEQVHQIGLQLFDYELFALPTEMAQHIALCCRNDLRSVFIAHDKRFLGIILQELYALVHTHRVLSPAQAQLLREGIVPTILPGSPEFQELASQARRDPETKNRYILKPIREARGTGILLGRDISATQWDAILTSMESSSSGIYSAGETTYILQPLIKLQSFDCFWDEERRVRKSRTVGTYYSVNGRFVGFGMWRTGSAAENVISASTKDVTTVLSAVLD
ncbi:hypothetical protein CNMCM6069_005350 [Aspergillus lentulus]|nr:hypothetical protein CNMCM6069_005350 [Aspergillus lentulus]